jgi:thiol-disulfide isomerase/thioredoxin
MNPDIKKARVSRTGNRRWMLATSVAAVTVGLGASLWYSRRTPAPSEGAQQVTDLAPDFWALQWPGPDDKPVALHSFQGKPLLLNFWATWCGPCIQELPLINDFYRQHAAQGWQVVGVAIDKAPAVQSFLAHAPLDFPVAVAGFAGLDLARALGDVSGSLPFSLAVGTDGSVALRKLGALTSSDFSALSGLK